MKRKISFVLLGMVCAMGIYSFFIEPNWLEVTQYEMKGNVKRPLKIAHISDLHFGNFFRLGKQVLREVEREHPDIIMVTGDSYEDLNQIEEMKIFFTQLKAPLGVWGVKGNWENWVLVQNEQTFWKEVGVTLLINQKNRAREDIEIFGYDDEISGFPLRDIANLDTNLFRICLFHSPSFFERASKNCSLSLSGHTHGGQIKIPFWGPLWIPVGSGPYLAGWYQIEDSRMFVTRGLGTSIFPLRFGARPEMSFITVSP